VIRNVGPELWRATFRIIAAFAPLTSGQGMDADRYARGEFFIADDFDASLPQDVQRYFEGEGEGDDTP
jgi:hypothetical protein